MRRLTAALAIIATVAAGGIALSSDPAVAAPAAKPAAAAPAAEQGANGSYTAITPYRAAATATGVNGNRKGALPPGVASAVSLDGHVPTDTTGVVISLTATGATAAGALQTYQYHAEVPDTWTLRYRPSTTSTVTAIVPLLSDRFNVRNIGSRPVGFIVDVVGYYNSYASVLHPGLLTYLPDRRILPPTTVLAPGQGRAVQTNSGGTAGLHVHVVGASAAGYLSIYRTGGSAPSTGTFFYGAGGGNSGFTLARTDDAGMVTVVNHGKARVQLALDITATFAPDSTLDAGGLQPVAQQRLLTGRSLGAGKVTSVAVAGQRGIARANLTAAVVAVTVGGPSKSGQIVVGAPGRTSLATRTLSFNAGQTLGATVIAPVSNGNIEIRNGSAGSLLVYVDVLGYVPSNSLTLPPRSASIARYLSNLTESGTGGANRDTLRGEGCSDVKTSEVPGASFALLDVGAQSYRTRLSKTSPGVALANSSPTQRLTYAELVDAVKGYIDGAADPECNSPAHSVRIAVGTNNSGNFADTSDPANPPYSAYTRGADWFAKVIKPLQAYAATKTAVTVAAAADIENDAAEFDGEYTNAQTWENSYLAAAKGSQDDKLVFNGAAIDCPAYFGDTTSNCNEGWTLTQFVSLTTNSGRVQTLPQIYTATTAAQWTNVAAAALKVKRSLAFLGALTQQVLDSHSYGPAAGWAALYRGLSSVIDTPSVPRSAQFLS